jgi:hypothetical protein
MDTEKCEFGQCKHWWNCSKKNGKCKKHEFCETYMAKYDNDIELWRDLHGEYYNE